jgi:hypothetical protein
MSDDDIFDEFGNIRDFAINKNPKQPLKSEIKPRIIPKINPENNFNKFLIPIIIISAVAFSIFIIYLVFSMGSSSYYLNVLDFPQSFNLNSFADILKLENPKLIPFRMGNIANVTLLPYGKLTSISIMDNIKVNYISICNPHNTNHINCYDVFISENIGANTNQGE